MLSSALRRTFHSLPKPARQAIRFAWPKTSKPAKATKDDSLLKMMEGFAEVIFRATKML